MVWPNFRVHGELPRHLHAINLIGSPYFKNLLWPILKLKYKEFCSNAHSKVFLTCLEFHFYGKRKACAFRMPVSKYEMYSFLSGLVISCLTEDRTYGIIYTFV